MTELSEEELMRVDELERANEEIRDAFPALYAVLGQNYYEKPEGCEAAITATTAQLDAMTKQLHINYLEILELKRLRLCPNCRSEVEEGEVFCGECGTRMETIEIDDEESVVCSRCGAGNARVKKFCVICGQRLVKQLKEDGSAMSEAERLRLEAEKSAKTEAERAFKEAAVTELQEDIEAADNGQMPVPGQPMTEPESFAPEEPMTGADEPASAKTAEELECPSCGTRLPFDALYCAECGIRVQQTLPVEEPLTGTAFGSESGTGATEEETIQQSSDGRVI